jgi:hypothetical protein
MARKIPLRTVRVLDGEFDYGQTMEMILRSARPNQGLTFEEVEKCSAALTPLLEAREAKAGEVLFADDQWRTLCEKLGTFAFPFADPEMVIFGRLIKDAPEVGLGVGNGSDSETVAERSIPRPVPGAAA